MCDEDLKCIFFQPQPQSQNISIPFSSSFFFISSSWICCNYFWHHCIWLVSLSGFDRIHWKRNCSKWWSETDRPLRRPLQKVDREIYVFFCNKLQWLPGLPRPNNICCLEFYLRPYSLKICLDQKFQCLINKTVCWIESGLLLKMQ